MSMRVDHRVEPLTSAISICSRKSGPVSMTTRVVPPFAAMRSTSAAARVRRFFGLAGSQLPQSPVMRGVPGDEPQPRMVRRSRSRHRLRRPLGRARHLGEQAEEIVRGDRGDLGRR